MAESAAFYLVVVSGGDARLVQQPAVLRGKGLERYGCREDLLTTLDPGGSTQAIVIGDQVIALGDPRAAHAEVDVDGAAAQVLVVCPDGSTPPAELRHVTRWLALAVLNGGGGVTTAQRPPQPRAALDTPLNAAVVRDWRPPALTLAIGLALGLLVGWLVTSSGDAAAAKPPAPTSGAAASGPSDDLAATDLAATDLANGTNVSKPIPEAGSPEAGSPEAGPSALPTPAAATGSDAASAGGAAGAGGAAAAAVELTLTQLVALPPVSLWHGANPTTAPDITKRCNVFGDLELSATIDGAAVQRVVVCGLFRRRSTRASVRTAVCVPSLERCADLAKVAERLTPSHICTPLSGAPYGLAKARRGQRPHYRSGAAQAGYRRIDGKLVRDQCRRAAPYARALKRL